MTSLKAKPARSPAPDPQDPNLAVLSRSNHDMRSPLSVILGVLELLEDSAHLDDGERRFLELGRNAANDLLNLADAVRLYTGMRRGTVCVDAAPTPIYPSLRQTVAETLADRGIPFSVTVPDPAVTALCDIGYLKLACAALTRHLADRLTDASDPDIGLDLSIAAHAGRVRIELRPAGRPGNAAEPLMAEPGGDAVALCNAVSLVRQMHGQVRFDPAVPVLSVDLPATA